MNKFTGDLLQAKPWIECAIIYQPRKPIVSDERRLYDMEEQLQVYTNEYIDSGRYCNVKTGCFSFVIKKKEREGDAIGGVSSIQ